MQSNSRSICSEVRNCDRPYRRKSPHLFSSTSSTAEGEGLFPSPSMLYIVSRTFARFMRIDMDPSERFSRSVVLEFFDSRSTNDAFRRKSLRSCGQSWSSWYEFIRLKVTLVPSTSSMTLFTTFFIGS